MELRAAVEAVLFSSNGISAEKISEVLGVSIDDVLQILEELRREYEKPSHGVSLREVEGKYRFYTKPEYVEYVSKVSKRKFHKLSDSQMEVIALLLVSGPLSKNDVDSFRGKDSSAVLSSLQKMGIVRKKRVGRTYLYHLTRSFLESTMLEELVKSEKLSGDGGES